MVSRAGAGAGARSPVAAKAARVPVRRRVSQASVLRSAALRGAVVRDRRQRQNRIVASRSIADNEGATEGQSGQGSKEESDVGDGGGLPEQEPQPAENVESDLWSFIGSSGDEEGGTFGANSDPWLAQGLSSTGEDEPKVSEEDLLDDLKNELEKARGEKEELEVVRLKLESEAQDLAELAVEANERSGEAAARVTTVVDQIAEVESEEQEVAKELKQAKKTLKKALKRQKKKMARLEAASAEEEDAGEEQAGEQSEGATAAVEDEVEADAAQPPADEDSVDFLQRQVETLEAAFKMERAPADAEDDERDWMDEPASLAETSGSGEDGDGQEGEAEAFQQPDQSELERLLREVEEIKEMEQVVLDSRDQRDKLAIERAKLENEVAQLEQESEELVQSAILQDQKAAEAMEDVEKAVAAEMSAEARLEEVENKTEDFLHDLLKQRKEEQKAVASMNEEALGEVSAPEGVPKISGLEPESVVYSGDDLAAELSEEKIKIAEEKVSALVSDVTELLEEVETTVEEEDVKEKEEELKAEEEGPAAVAAAPVVKEAAEPKVVVEAEPVSADATDAEAAGQPKEAEESALAIRKLSKAKQAAKKRNVFSNPRVRSALGVLVLAASLGAGGVFAHRRGYVTKAAQVFQAQVLDRIQPHRRRELEEQKSKKRRWGKKKAQEALKEAEHGSESGMTDTLWLLATCVVAVPLITKLPGGSPVLGFLLGGAFIGPNALGIINNVNAVKHIAELGVIFLLFNIGLELSFERLQAMQKYVFGLGASQVVVTMMIAAWLGVSVLGLNGPGATILAAAMSLSSTAVALQVLQDRGEASSRHGRAAFSVLLFQDLAVVVFLMLTPLLAQSQASGAVGGQEQVKMFLLQIGQAIVKACVAIAAIIAGGRVAFRPIYKRIAKTGNNEIFAATTLLVVLGTSMLTQKFGLSMELGAFIAGLLLAETEYALQIESDIAPYKGLLLGLFFMTVGMEFSMTLLVQQWRAILATMAVLLVGKTAVVALAGPIFGLSRIASIRAGLMLAPGGEFAFVLLGDAAAKAILAGALCSQMYLVVALGMALTPMLGALGNALDDMYENKDVLKLQPSEGEVDDLRGHVIVAGFGRVGQMICQLLGEQFIPFTALDVRSDRVAKGRDMEMPVYFGDSGSAAVLHSVGASKAACAVVVLDTPGANYRCVWAIKKHYPNVKVYVRARDVAHGLNLERAGASAVVPETLEPSLQLAAAVLQEMKIPQDEVGGILDVYRRKHLEELSELAFVSGSSLGYVKEEEEKKEKEKVEL